tara:strand:+ start:342 stop:590 length:249 start_codon:yes stop_codon:yes gene_type:complete
MFLKKLSPKARLESVMVKYSGVIRERAISQAKAKITLNAKAVSDFTEEQLEIIVAEEEIQIKSRIRKSIFMSFLAIFGIASF